MIQRAYHATVFALYQLTVAVGIALLPLALAVRKFGIAIPAHRVVESLASACECESGR